MSTAAPAATPQMSPEEAVRRIAQAREVLVREVHKVIIGQDEMIEQMLICIFARGHCLTIGVPGLAKTLTVSTLAQALHLKFTPHPVHARPDAQRHHGHGDHRPGPGHRASGRSASCAGRSSPTSCWPTRSTARRRRPRPRCCRRCRSTK